jgi:hypothetical protein
LVVFEDAIVLRVRDVEIADAVHRGAGGIAQVVRAAIGRIEVATARSEEVALPEDQVRGHAGAERRVVFEYSAILLVSDVEIAAAVHRNSFGDTHAARGNAAVVAIARGKAGLPNHHVGGAAGKRGLVFEHAAVVEVGHQEVAT